MVKFRTMWYTAELNYRRCWSRGAEILLMLAPGSLHLLKSLVKSVTWTQTSNCVSAACFVYWSLVVTVCDS